MRSELISILEQHGYFDQIAEPEQKQVALHVIADRLEELGIGAEGFAKAEADGTIHRLAPDLALLGPGTLTSEELADAAGTTADIVEEFWLHAGLQVPPRGDRSYHELDIALLEAFLPSLELFERDVAYQMLRVIGSSLARIASAVEAAFITNIERSIIESGGDETDLAVATVAALKNLTTIQSVLGILLGNHIRASIDRSRIARQLTTSWDTAIWSVGFVDLTGYTSISEDLDPGALASLVTTFERTTHEVVTSAGGQVVKLIGDEAMFVAPTAELGARIILQLCARLESLDKFATPHGGLSFGEVITKDGDFHGPVVNLASRACAVAVPNEILISQPVADALEGVTGMEAEGAGRRMLKGFRQPIRLFSLTART